MRDLNPSMLLRLRVSSLRDLKRKSLGLSRVTGEKRSAGNITNQTELPKKRRVSKDGATKNKILAEVVYQPCQKQ